jgi:hypothetical protein
MSHSDADLSRKTLLDSSCRYSSFGEPDQSVPRSRRASRGGRRYVIELMPMLHVFGIQKPIDEQQLGKGIELGAGRTFEQNPKYAIRLLVDIAIRALSPAVNDPTTAV